jgi:outer membrane receptor protein involved in Fe transport
MNMLERGRGAWLLLALAGFLLNGAPLQGQSGTISGRVVSDEGEPIAGAQVQVLGPRSTRGAVTDASGRFSVPAPAGGSYRLRVHALGYRSVERELSRAAEAMTTVDLALKTTPVALSGVVVSATRTQTPVAAIPGAVSVITQAQVEEQAAVNQNIGDLLAQVVPGLGAGMQAPGLHGQSLRGRNISVLIDGVPQSTTRNVMRDLSTIDPAMIERVEVLRGATAIYGDGATGGVINIITRAPVAGGARFTTTLGGEVSGSEWSEGTGGRLAQSVSGRSGAMDYVVSGTLNRVGDYYDAEGDLIPSDPHGQGGLAETTGHDLFGKFGFDFGTRRLQLSANRYVSEQETQYVSDLSVDTLPAGTVKARPMGGLQLAENQGTENTQVSLNFTESDLLGSRLRGQLFHRDYRTVFRPYDARAVASRAAIIQSWLESDKTGGRLELESPLPLRGESMVLWGADYTRETTSQPVHIFDNDVYDQSGGLVFEKIDERVWVPVIQPRSLGLFAQIALRPVERVMLRGGVRHERARMEVPDFTTLIGEQVTGGELEFDPTLFNVGAVVDATEALSLYASFAGLLTDRHRPGAPGRPRGSDRGAARDGGADGRSIRGRGAGDVALGAGLARHFPDRFRAGQNLARIRPAGGARAGAGLRRGSDARHPAHAGAGAGRHLRVDRGRELRRQRQLLARDERLPDPAVEGDRVRGAPDPAALEQPRSGALLGRPRSRLRGPHQPRSGGLR